MRKENETHKLEFGIFALAQIIEEELGNSGRGGLSENLAGYSHGYVAEFPMRESDDDPAFIEELRKPFEVLHGIFPNRSD